MEKENNEKIKQNTIYAFIDAQNLTCGITNSFEYWAGKGKKRQYLGWKLDMKKLRVYLRDKFKVSKAILFMGLTIRDMPKCEKSSSLLGLKLSQNLILSKVAK